MIDCPILADNCFLLLDFRVLASIAFRGFKSNHQIPFFVCDCCLAIQESLVPFLPPLENPLAPEQRYMHSRVFYKYLPWHGNFEAGYLVDWLGVRTRSNFIMCHEKSLSRTTESATHHKETHVAHPSQICLGLHPRRPFQPSRRLRCSPIVLIPLRSRYTTARTTASSS
jgi:hypothetical protein